MFLKTLLYLSLKPNSSHLISSTMHKFTNISIFHQPTHSFTLSPNRSSVNSVIHPSTCSPIHPLSHPSIHQCSLETFRGHYELLQNNKKNPLFQLFSPCNFNPLNEFFFNLPTFSTLYFLSHSPISYSFIHPYIPFTHPPIKLFIYLSIFPYFY